MVKIKFPDGAIRSYESGLTPYEIASSISSGLARSIISSDFNGQKIETTTQIFDDGNLTFYTWKDNEGKEAFWHSTAHLLAQVLEEFYDGIKLTIGPAISNGFYYDVDFGEHSMSEKDFLKIEKRMIEIAREKHEFKLRSISKKEALDFYKKNRNQYKTELIENLKDGEITFCDHDNFTDLCRGGHIPHTGLIKAVKLMSVAGAYWRADQNNTQLTRVYGISFPKQKELTEYLNLLEEAKKRDHRKLGKELELFTFSSKVGQGLPLWLPKGAELRERLESFLKKAQKKAGYKQVISPHIGNKELYTTSGHYQKYGESSFQPISTPADGEEFLLKPMNCPHHCEMYNSKQWSYKELPVRYAEFGTVYRYEQSGELHGLTRVRGFTQDDAHIFCTEEQITEECLTVTNLILEIYKDLGFEDVILKYSDRPELRVGDDQVWDKSEAALLEAIKATKLEYSINKGEGAFYGPKIEFVLRDAIGRDWQCGTLQVDLNLPGRLGASFVDSDGNKKVPVMLHRALFGSLERFIGILIENYSGKLPFWLCPIQTIVIPISSDFDDYAKQVNIQLKKIGLTSEVDLKNHNLNYKIREHSLTKVPMLLICGKKEVDSNTVTIRRLDSKKQETMDINKFLKEFSALNKAPSI